MALAQSQARPQQTYLAQQGMGRGGPSGLAEVLDVLLDKGLVIDAFVRVSLVGIELLTIDARVVIASVDTYLRFAEAVNRLDLLQAGNSQNLGDLVGGGKSGSRALSSKGRANDEPSRRDETEDEGEASPSRRDEPDEPEGRGDDPSDDAQDEARGGDSSEEPEGAADDKGLLSRIKERGQVF